MLNNIKVFLSDCDGVLTDAGMYYFDNGLEAKKFNTRDGMAFSMLKKMNIKIGIITGETTKIVENRADKLKMDILYMGVLNKKEIVDKICNDDNISYENILYVGDDINDIEVLKIVGFSCCPNDACKEVKNVCNYICSSNGGYGVIREIVDKCFREKNQNE